MSSSSSQWIEDRFVDPTVINDVQLCPIYGYENEEILSLERSLEFIQTMIPFLADHMKIAKEHCHFPNEHCLTHDQSASIYLYSMEWGENSFYRILNIALRTEDRNTLKSWFPFLKLFHTALQLLPNLKCNIWRGVRSVLIEQYQKGKEIIWWSVNSCSSDIDKIKHFLGNNGILFLIEALNARDITGYTRYPNEHEFILLPGTRLQVVANCMDYQGVLRLLHLREISSTDHPSHLPLISLEKVSEKQTKDLNCLSRTCSRRFYVITTIIVILIAIGIGLTIGLIKLKKKPIEPTLSSSISMTESSTTLDFIQTENATSTRTTTSIDQTTDRVDQVDKQLFGTQTSRIDIPFKINLLQDLGVQIFRILVSWHQLEEYEKNNKSTLYLKKLDNLISSLEKEHIRILICLYETPCWASSSSKCDQGKYRPNDYNDYADAMVFLLEYYRNRIYAWEIWNEPNRSENWLRPQCETNDGLCPRSFSLNDEHMIFIDLIAAQEYSNMIKITYEKIKSIDSNAIVLAGSLLGSDRDYLNEMYKSGIQDFMDGLSIHSYIDQTLEGAEKYGPDECLFEDISSKFWCFKHGIEQIRQLMIEQNDSSKSIWITEFGFSSSDFERISGWSRQINYLEYAIDIIQQQWSFVHVACYFELHDQGETATRKGLFGLYDKNLNVKGSGQMFARKIKYKFSSLSKTILRRSNTTIVTPLGIYPHGAINTYTPYFSWPSSPRTRMYQLWVDDHGIPLINGRIIEYLTPEEANCPRNEDQFCRFISSIQFTESGGKWWAMVIINGSDTLLTTQLFTIE